MVPQIIKTKDYVEYIGHYSDIKMCAKLSALASLLATEVRSGYAKFPIEYKDKVNEALNCELNFANHSYDIDLHSYYFNISSNIVSFKVGDTTYDISDYDWVEFGNPINVGTGTHPNGNVALISSIGSIDNITLYINDASVVLYYGSNASETFNVGDDIVVNDEGNYLYTISIEQYSEPSLDPIETSIKIGTKSLANAYVGSTKINKAYIGNHLIFERFGSNFFTSDNKMIMTSDDKVFNVQLGGYSVTLRGYYGNAEKIYVQLNDDPTWYYAELHNTSGFYVDQTNIPNIYEVEHGLSIGVNNISKIKIGTEGNPSQRTGPEYISNFSTGDFANLSFTSTGSSAPAYATQEITMTQNSEIRFYGDD